MFMSYRQVSPPNLFLKLWSCNFCMTEFLRQCSKSWKDHPRKEGKYVKNLICLQMRLGVEMCSSGIIIHKGHLCQKYIFTYYSFQWLVYSVWTGKLPINCKFNLAFVSFEVPRVLYSTYYYCSLIWCIYNVQRYSPNF